MNGDGHPDLDASKITYFGQSFGGIYGTTFLGVEPAVHAGVVNVPGGSITEIARLSPSFRPLVGIALATRMPTLYNAVPNPTFTNFNEDEPLSGQPIVVDTVPGATRSRTCSTTTSGRRRRRIRRVGSDHPGRAGRRLGAEGGDRPVREGRRDRAEPDRVGADPRRRAEDRATYFRNDLAFATVPGYTVKNPHTFLSNIAGASGRSPSPRSSRSRRSSRAAARTIDPDGPGPCFETPIAGPLPEALNFLP